MTEQRSAPSERPSGRVDARHLAAWRAFLAAHATVIDRIEHDLAAARQLPLGAYDVLFALEEAPGRRLRMHELASAVVLNRSTLSRRVDRLEREGLLARERAGTDRRGAYAVLTERGREALRAAWPVYAHGIEEYFAAHLTEAEARMLTEALRRVANGVGAGGADANGVGAGGADAGGADASGAVAGTGGAGTGGAGG